MLAASCHCGAVRLEVPRKPRTLTDCNCSICRRYGTLWAYYRAPSVRLTHAPGAVSKYSWGKKSLTFVRCNTCGCIMNHERTTNRDDGWMGVNARNFDPVAIAGIRVRKLDGASSWKYLD